MTGGHWRGIIFIGGILKIILGAYRTLITIPEGY